MIPQQSVDTAISKLSLAIQSGRLPENVAKTAARISKRLSNPVRFAIMGLAGSGKSQLLNFLAGADVIPIDVALPSISVVWGDTARTICTLPDGSTLTFDQFDRDEVTELEPVFLQQELPLPALKKISFLEVAMGDTPLEQQKALALAARETDVALWCTQSFAQQEADLWCAMPERLQDHSFLVMTKADLPEIQATMVERMASLGDIAVDQFHSIFPVQTMHAIAARGADGTVDKDQLTASGGRALIGAILRTVDQGTQASLDGADILFSQNDITTEPERPDDERTAVLESDGTDGEKMNVAVVGYLSSRAAELHDNLTGPRPKKSNFVMENCLTAGEWLIEKLTSQAGDDLTESTALDSVQNAVDLMYLLQMEQQESAVEDAVVLLLQIRREFEQKIAA